MLCPKTKKHTKNILPAGNLSSWYLGTRFGSGGIRDFFGGDTPDTPWAVVVEVATEETTTVVEAGWPKKKIIFHFG